MGLSNQQFLNRVFTATPLSQLMVQRFPETEWLVQDLIPEDAVVLLSAPPASFKTWFSLELAKCVASGQKFLDRFETKQSGVLIMDGESGDRQTQKHFRQLGISPITDMPIYYSECCGHYMDEDFATNIELECDKYGIKLVIFDSLVRFHNANENDAKEMSKIFEGFSFLKRHGITSLIICHSRKGSNINFGRSMDAIRGSSDIAASCDLCLHAVRVEGTNKVTISQPKNRFDEEIRPFTAYFTKEGQESNKWSFGEVLEDKKDIKNRHTNLIRGYIQAHPGRNQNQILNYLQTCDGNTIYSDKPLREILKQLENKNLIFSQHGKGKELLYYTVSKNNTNEEPQNA